MEALLPDTTYYVKIVAKDPDGSASPSSAGSAQLLAASGPDIRAGSVTTDHIAARSIVAYSIDTHVISAEHVVAGSITATEIAAATIVAGNIAALAVTSEKLETELVLSSTIVAGTAGGARLEFGQLAGGTGIAGYAADGSTVKFSVNADTGDVYAAGRLDFGQGSRLDSDIMELKELVSSGYQTPAVVQTVSEVDFNSTISVAWPQATTVGNQCLMFLSLWDSDHGPPSPATPSGWTLVTGPTSTSDMIVCVYRASTGASRSGTQTVTLNDTVYASVRLMELSGVQVVAADKLAGNSGASVSPASGSTATTSQTDEILLGVVSYRLQTLGGFEPTAPTAGFTSLGVYSTGISDGTSNGIGQRVYTRNVTSAGAYSFGVTLPIAQPWICNTITLKAKTAAVDAPDVGKLRIYALDDGHASSGNDASTIMIQSERGLEKSLEYPGLGRFHASTAPPYIYVHTDFCEAGTITADAQACGEGLQTSLSGAGAAIAPVSYLSHPGIARLSTGTTTTGQIQLRCPSTCFGVGSGRMRMGSLVRVSTLSDGTDTFTAGVGFKSFDGGWQALAATGNSLVVRYNHGTNSGKWQAASSNGGTSATADTGITVTANQWYWIEIDVAADWSEAKFYINGVLTATLNTSMPTGSMGYHAAGILKGVGTTARTIEIDFFYCYVETVRNTS